MKQELNYFTIGNSFGGNQDWFPSFIMKRGGCAAATACDSCIYFAKNFDRYRGLYPHNPQEVAKEDYIKFAMDMKPYLSPRMSGINKLSIYQAGIEKYFKEIGIKLNVHAFEGDMPYKDAKAFLISQLDNQYPIPYLLLRHCDREFKNFEWHWFLIVGYEIINGECFVDVATYSTKTRFSFQKLWETGREPKGGMIGFQM